MHCTWLLASAKTWCPKGPDVFVYTTVFCADLRLDFGGKTIAGLSAANGTRDYQNCYFNRTKVLMGIGTIGDLGF